MRDILLRLLLLLVAAVGISGVVFRIVRLNWFARFTRSPISSDGDSHQRAGVDSRSRKLQLVISTVNALVPLASLALGFLPYSYRAMYDDVGEQWPPNSLLFIPVNKNISYVEEQLGKARDLGGYLLVSEGLYSFILNYHFGGQVESNILRWMELLATLMHLTMAQIATTVIVLQFLLATAQVRRVHQDSRLVKWLFVNPTGWPLNITIFAVLFFLCFMDLHLMIEPIGVVRKASDSSFTFVFAMHALERSGYPWGICTMLFTVLLIIWAAASIRAAFRYLRQMLQNSESYRTSILRRRLFLGLSVQILLMCALGYVPMIWGFLTGLNILCDGGVMLASFVMLYTFPLLGIVSSISSQFISTFNSNITVQIALDQKNKYKTLSAALRNSSRRMHRVTRVDRTNE